MELKHKLEKIFNNDYPGTDRFIVDVIEEIFGNEIEYINDDLAEREEYAEKARKAGIKHIKYIGDLTEKNYSADNIVLLDVTLDDSKNIERSRVNIQQLIRSIMGFHQHLMIVFHYEDVKDKQWRFSYAYKGNSLKDTTSAKRYTYVFGKGYRGRTAAERFEILADSQRNDEDFEKAFSVQALSDDFFKYYRAYYAAFVEFITGERYTEEKEINNILNRWKWVSCDGDNQLKSTFENDGKAARDYIKKMFGRIVFLYFLQRKGWLFDKNGDSDPMYMRHLFEESERLGLDTNFLDDVLEILFFYILNTKGTENRIRKAFDERGKDVKIIPGWEKIYFLNGGLFEDDDFDRKPCIFPAVYFQKFFQFLDKFNFTINENDQEDAEIGIDPEMLGRIFENLLEDNKDKGAFYTPKEVVDYMCRESIIAYLQDDKFSEEGNDLIRAFVNDLDNRDLTLTQKSHLRDKLKEVKICDPAIGSGAFPMGMVNVLAKLYIALGIRSEELGAIKRHIVEENIYGVDIERGAVDIARLRFWLAIVVDEEVKEGDDPTPLPNLHFKVMQGNSLLERFDKKDLRDLVQIKKGISENVTTISNHQIIDGNIFDYDDSERIDLKRKLKKYYGTNDHSEKKGLFNEIVNIVRRLLFYKGVTLPEDFDPSANSDFFLWHTWFTEVFEQGGFDIVIGNPPYISAPAQVANEILNAQRKNIVASKQYKSLYQKWDLYIAFVELGLRMLKKGGIESMIIPYPFTNQLYAKKLRQMILDNHNIVEITDLKDVKVFANASVQNCILFVEDKKKEGGKVRISHAVEDEKTRSLEIKVDYEKDQIGLIQNSKGVWDLSTNITQDSLHPTFNRLGDFCYISKGMVLNSDEKTAKGQFKKDDLISNTKDELHSRAYIEAKDICSYGIKRYRYLEWDSDRCPCKLSRPTFRELYEVPKLLINILGTLQTTIDIKVNFLHNHSLYCAVPWYEFKDVNNKSISGSIKKFARKTRSDMEALSKQVSLQFLCAILNSSYGKVLLKEQRGGDYHIYPDHVKNIPIPVAPPNLQKEISALVDQLIGIEDKGSEKAQMIFQRIDLLVYKAYKLSYEEILQVDPKPSFSREEYDNFNIDII